MDPKLKLKPIELLNIGIDKLTKIPVPILNDNIISTFDVDNGVPVDTFILTYDTNYGGTDISIYVSSDYGITLSIDYGDDTTENWLVSGDTTINHIYPSALTYTVTVSGWIEKVITLILPSGGFTDAYLNKLKRLSYLDINGNRLINLNLEGMIYLNNINLNDNYFPNDVIDDLYIVTDTFLTFGGTISTIGDNNGVPSIYSFNARNSLSVNKEWTLNYNT